MLEKRVEEQQIERDGDRRGREGVYKGREILERGEWKAEVEESRRGESEKRR